MRALGDPASSEQVVSAEETLALKIFFVFSVDVLRMPRWIANINITRSLGIIRGYMAPDITRFWTENLRYLCITSFGSPVIPAIAEPYLAVCAYGKDIQMPH